MTHCLNELLFGSMQVNGKLRDKIEVLTDISEEEAVARVRSLPKISAILGDEEPAKIVLRLPRLINLVL